MVRDWLLHCLGYRDRKTRACRIGILMLVIGLALYVTVIAIMLLNPGANAVPAARGGFHLLSRRRAHRT